MTSVFATSPASDHDACAIASFCDKHDISREALYLAAWSYTLSIYSAASTVSTNLLRSTNQHPQGGVVPVSATFEGYMTILEACLSIQILDEGADVGYETFCSETTMGVDFFNGGTLMKFSQIEATDVSLEIRGPVQACLEVDVRGSITLRCQPHSLPAISADALLETFTTILTQFATTSLETRLKDIDVLGPVNRSILQGWSPSRLVAVERCIHDYVDEHALADPHKEAVVATEGPNFAYAQLSQCSSRLALRLLELGVKGGDIIPILFDKSSLAVLAIVAILKAGAAYVGFSAETPVNSLRECASIAAVQLIVTSRQHEGLVGRLGCRALVLDDELLSSLEETDVDTFQSPACPSDLAYLVFTSGSTGVPKAVMTEHKAYVTDALAQQQAALLTPSSRVLHFASYNFDATNFDVLSTLVAGGTVCVPAESDRVSRLAGAIADLGANLLGVTATLAQTLDPRAVPSLRTVILCGEANSPEIVAKWTARAPGGLDVVNGYGPSEASCAFSYNIYTRQNPRANNVGRALDGACWGWVVSPDDHERLLPVGARGELLIQGPTLSRGYLGEPEKTAGAFVRNPGWLPAGGSGTEPDMGRLYRTGDVVRQLPDRSFEVFGRIDTQVKLNGQRVELGEVEHRVRQVRSPERTVEVLDLSAKGKADSKVLAAFYAPGVGSHPRDSPVLDLIGSAAIDIHATRAKLANDLKAIAIPRAFVPLRVMPVTIQGKLDRKLLQALGRALDKNLLASYSGHAVVVNGDPVSGEFEELVRELFLQTLNLERGVIFRDSDFFAMGGDSVQGIKLVSLARKQGFNLSVPDILQNPTVRDLAGVAERSKTTTGGTGTYQPFAGILDTSALDEVRTKAAEYTSGVDDIEDITPATDLQASCVAFSTYREERRGINWLLCDFETPHNEETVRQMCQTLVQKHPTLRTFFVAHQRTLYQVISKSFQPTIRTHLHVQDVQKTTRCLMESDLRTRAVQMTEPQTAFELLSQTNAARIQRLIIRLSAAQYDGHSVSILGRDMTSLLGGAQLPVEPRGSYAAYMHHARTVELDRGLEYWRTLLKGAEMPQIAERQSRAPSGLDFVDGVLVKMVDTRLLDLDGTATTTKLSPRSTRATVVKTAWALTLARLTGKTDVVFGSTGWGRNHAVGYAQDVAGSCTSHIPTRARIGGTSTCGELLEQLRAQHVESMRFENIGASTIVEKCTAWQRWTRFSSLVVFQGLDIQTAAEGEEGPPEGARAVKLTEIMDPGDRTDIVVHVEPFGRKTRVMMAFARKNVPEDVADVMMKTFEEYLEKMAQGGEQAIELSLDSPPLLPVLVSGVGPKVGEGRAGGVEDAQAESIVKQVWMDVLDVAEGEFDNLEQRGESFLAVWGNPVSAAALAHEYRRRGHAVSTEDMLRNQTATEQMKMVGVLGTPASSLVEADMASEVSVNTSAAELSSIVEIAAV
ncbi:Nonribosomal peptide synthetase 6 [Colletotrichum spinosum]|uniref:Nonribosomal peptide synthetase 6 n=1 Tax=Colletotrichum spinosum TaxID=1347390 RepID=A0A4R8Q4D6_9PEZI|nr:Nonribosomal peptide synthetase 6 [Colletotrichum spinosum]